MYPTTDAKIPSRELWNELGLPEDFLHNLVLSEEPDPAINSSFKLGSIAQVSSNRT